MLRMLIALFCLLFSAQAKGDNQSEHDYQHVITLLSTTTTVTGEPLAYPIEGQATVTSLIVSMEPGEETGWHQHGVPAFGYILEGELTIAYEGQDERVFTQGMALVDAMHITHNGTNTGEGICRILVVFMGDGIAENVIRD